MRFLPVCWLLTHIQQYLARFQKESDMHEILVQVRPDLYALAWLVGITLLLSWLLLRASKALHKWRVLIQQETAHQAEQAAILSHAVSLSRPGDWVSGNRGTVAAGAAGPAYMTVNYEDIELRILAGMTEQEVAEMLARPRARERQMCNMGPEELARAREM